MTVLAIQTLKRKNNQKTKKGKEEEREKKISLGPGRINKAAEGNKAKESSISVSL